MPRPEWIPSSTTPEDLTAQIVEFDAVPDEEKFWDLSADARLQLLTGQLAQQYAVELSSGQWPGEFDQFGNRINPHSTEPGETFRAFDQLGNDAIAHTRYKALAALHLQHYPASS